MSTPCPASCEISALLRCPFAWSSHELRGRGRGRGRVRSRVRIRARIRVRARVRVRGTCVDLRKKNASLRCSWYRWWDGEGW